MIYLPLLSVIVPCYNVEKYLDKCISSIVDQTYTNLEILLIDDGSPDNSGMICDAWQERDQRIRVIHKENEGVSYARKTGVENATAEYVTFVDSDDCIDPNMYSDMMAAMISTNSDIAQCEYCEVFDDGQMKHRGTERNAASIEIIGREEGVLLIVKDVKWKSYMWNKIFKKQLLNHIVFSKGQVYEDLSIMHILFHHAYRSVYLSAEYYFYFRKIGSITISSSLSVGMKNFGDFAKAHFERYLFINQHPEYQNVLSLTQKKAIIFGVSLLKKITMYPQYFPNEDFTGILKQLRSIPYPQGEKLRFTKNQLRIILMGIRLYRFVISFYARLIRVTNR